MNNLKNELKYLIEYKIKDKWLGKIVKINKVSHPKISFNDNGNHKVVDIMFQWSEDISYDYYGGGIKSYEIFLTVETLKRNVQSMIYLELDDL